MSSFFVLARDFEQITHSLDVLKRVILAIVTTLGAIGASPIPNAGLVILVSIWEAVFPGVPLPPQVSWIISIDWLLDRCETTGSFAPLFFPHCVLTWLAGV